MVEGSSRPRFRDALRKLAFEGGLAAGILWMCGSAANAVVLFSDDFNRPDSATVGNGWTSVAEPGGGFLEVSGGILRAGVTVVGGVPRAAVIRPLAFNQRLSISGRLFDSDGNPSVPPGGAFYHQIAVANDGSPDQAFPDSLASGFGISILRNDSAGLNSYVQLFDNGTVRGVADFPDTFITSDVLFMVSFDPDGSVEGVLTNPDTLAQFAFSFGPSPVQSTGGNLIYLTGGNSRPPNGAEIVNLPGVDDLRVEAIPEPGSMFVTMLVAGALVRRGWSALRRR